MVTLIAVSITLFFILMSVVPLLAVPEEMRDCIVIGEPRATEAGPACECACHQFRPPARPGLKSLAPPAGRLHAPINGR